MESPLLKKIMLALGTLPGVRSFRNNVGLGWTGIKSSQSGGVVMLKNARPLKTGLHKGSADLIGWKTIIVTNEMVGRKIAVFLSVEVKDGAKGRMSGDQETWLSNVNKSGGIAIVARSEADAVEQIAKAI